MQTPRRFAARRSEHADRNQEIFRIFIALASVSTDS
jgi:hypothetical protein